MATEKKITKYEVNPIEDEKGFLAGLRIQRTERIQRVSASGAVLDHGYVKATDVGEPLEIPLSKAQALIADMNEWLVYFASGAAAREAAQS